MRRTWLAFCLGGTLALVSTAPARAAGMLVGEGGVLDFAVSFLEEDFAEDVDLDDDQRFVGAFTYAVTRLAGGELRVDVMGDPDPMLDFRIELENLSADAQTVTYVMIMPIVPLGPVSRISASLDLSVVDEGGAGASFLVPLGPTLQQAFVSEDGAVYTPLGVDLGLGVLPPGASFSVGPVPGPTPPAGQAWRFLAITGAFSISAGDRGVLDGNVTLVPEPAVASLIAALLVAAEALSVAARRRKR